MLFFYAISVEYLILSFISIIETNFFDSISSWWISSTSTPSSSCYIFTPVIIECWPIEGFKPFSIGLKNDFTTLDRVKYFLYECNIKDFLNQITWAEAGKYVFLYQGLSCIPLFANQANCVANDVIKQQSLSVIKFQDLFPTEYVLRTGKNVQPLSRPTGSPSMPKWSR